MRQILISLLFLTMCASAQDVTSWISGASADVVNPKGFDATLIDKSVDPCADFYNYACGGWRKTNPIPADKPSYGRFNQLFDNNQLALKEILERVSDAKATRTPIEQQVGDYFAACMDESGIEKAGSAPLSPELRMIADAKTKADVIKVMGQLRREGLAAAFNFGVGADLKDSSKTLINVDQGGTTLPDRDYYLKADPKTIETREKYVQHMTNMFKLLGDSPDQAAANAKTVLTIETKLADAQMDRISRRNPTNRDHKMPRPEMEKLAPSFDFASYFIAAEAPAFTENNVGNPDFFKKFEATWQQTPAEDWKTYLRWHLLRATANALSKAFVDESFSFFGNYLQGTKELEPRWKRCARATDGDLGEALGQLYVEKTFGAEGKTRMQKMVAAITKSLAADIKQLDWMTEPTKAKALEKLELLNKQKIGYPDKWRDYSSVKIQRTGYFGNGRRADQFEVKRNYDKLGKPVDKTEWGMTPPTVNAYYNPQFAEIVFPAGILQPPFFDRTMDDAVNFGGIGAVIGHELSHGFDDQGRKFDSHGNLADWWTEADGKAFEERAACIDKQYSGYSPLKDPKTGEPVYLQGKLTLGENIGDNGGIRIAYMALEDILTEAERQKLIDGFTPEQRFFLGFSQIWCQNSTDQRLLQLQKTDPHSPGEFRANGAISNMEEFAKAFSCKQGQKMAPEKRCRVW